MTCAQSVSKLIGFRAISTVSEQRLHLPGLRIRCIRFRLCRAPHLREYFAHHTPVKIAEITSKKDKHCHSVQPRGKQQDTCTYPGIAQLIFLGQQLVRRALALGEVLPHEAHLSVATVVAERGELHTETSSSVSNTV